jgi:hypothetical protein
MIQCDKLDARILNETQNCHCLPREPIELGNYQRRATESARSERLLKFWPVVSPPCFNLSEFGEHHPMLPLDVLLHGLPLTRQPESRLALRTS